MGKGFSKTCESKVRQLLTWVMILVKPFSQSKVRQSLTWVMILVKPVGQSKVR